MKFSSEIIASAYSVSLVGVVFIFNFYILFSKKEFMLALILTKNDS